MAGDITQSLITAGAGFAGVIVGGALAWLREAYRDQKTSTQQGRYLAIRVVCALDEFIDRCTDVVADSGVPDEHGISYADVHTPKDFDLPEDVDWKCINYDLMYKILALKSRIDRDNRYIGFAGEHAALPDRDEYFEERQWRYACLGLDVIEIIESLRKKFKIPLQNREEWDPKEYFKERREHIDAKREASKMQHDEFINEMYL